MAGFVGSIRVAELMLFLKRVLLMVKVTSITGLER